MNYCVTTAMCWCRSSVHKSSFSSSKTFCFCAAALGSAPGFWTSYLIRTNRKENVKDQRKVHCTRKHHFRSLINREPLLEMLIHEVMVIQHQSHDPKAKESISLCLHPEKIRWNLLTSDWKRMYFAHRRIISFVLIQFLLHSMSKF